MKEPIHENHPVATFFQNALHETLIHSVGSEVHEKTEQYLTRMLLKFLHEDAIFSIRDARGKRVESIAEMLLEGDVRANADSFDREREVHQHIGDFLLFWTGLFPEFLRTLKMPGSKDTLINYTEQGRYSYYVASTFVHPPYHEEAPTLGKLSKDFEMYQFALGQVRNHLHLGRSH